MIIPFVIDLYEHTNFIYIHVYIINSYTYFECKIYSYQTLFYIKVGSFHAPQTEIDAVQLYQPLPFRILYTIVSQWVLTSQINYLAGETASIEAGNLSVSKITLHPRHVIRVNKYSILMGYASAYFEAFNCIMLCTMVLYLINTFLHINFCALIFLSRKCCVFMQFLIKNM